MKISDQVALAAKNLSRRKGRTALTVIGVVVGTCAVIVMISLGIAQNKSYDEMLASWGDLTQIQVYGGSMGVAVSIGGTTVSSSSSEAPPKLNDEMVETFKAMEHVIAVTPYYEGYNLQGRISAGMNERYQITGLYDLYGIDPAAMEPMGFELADGEWLSDSANYGKDTLPVLVGTTSGYNFQDTRRSYTSTKRQRWAGQTDASGKELPPFVDVNKDDMTLTLTDGDPDAPKEKTWKLKVVGTMAVNEKYYWTQSGIVLRLKDMKMLIEENNDLLNKNNNYYETDLTEYQNVYVKVDDMDNVDEVGEAIKAYGFSTYSMSDTREEMQKQVGRNQMMLGGLAAISLFVAALNIANTMTMAIYERTREIGVMKVLGCELKNIRRMFLIESGFIGFIGGVAGALLSWGVSFILNNLLVIASGVMMLLQSLGVQANLDLSFLMNSGMGTGSTMSIIPLWLVGVALVFATVIGILSGIAPANRAVRISALEAIRHE